MDGFLVLEEREEFTSTPESPENTGVPTIA
jgi:hypothetical protein